MRQAINNLQSTWSGFGFVSQDNVFKICDQPHPLLVRTMIKHCQKAEVDEALARVDNLWDQGYSAVDIVTTIFRVVKGMDDLPEYTKLEYIRVRLVVEPSGSSTDRSGDWLDAYARVGRCRNSGSAGSYDCSAVPHGRPA
jgi:hypothetical protein